MSNDPMRIHLSLVSHTNIGKTTLARTSVRLLTVPTSQKRLTTMY